MKYFINAFALLFVFIYVQATPKDTTYTIDLSRSNVRIIGGHLKLGTNRSPKGEVPAKQW